VQVVILCAVLQSKKLLKDGIDRFIEEKILLAAKAISEDACLKICDGDVILVYSRLLLFTSAVIIVGQSLVWDLLLDPNFFGVL